MGIKQEFEKALDRSLKPGRLSGQYDPTPLQNALWGANYAFEMVCIKLCRYCASGNYDNRGDKHHGRITRDIVDCEAADIRQLSKDLSTEEK